MRYHVLSFDLQGTLSEAAFSDGVWREFLPQLYSVERKVSLTQAKAELTAYFRKIGRYDLRYYALDFWLEALGISTPWEDLVQQFPHPPSLIHPMEKLVWRLSPLYPLLLFSSTTRAFIHYELGNLRPAFRWVISSLDDLQEAGKSPQAFKQAACYIGVKPEGILHIGDDPLMDVENARAAGWHAYHLPDPSNPVELCRFLELS